MNVSPQQHNETFPHGFADLLARDAARRHNAGGYEIQPERLPLFNDALRRISPDTPPLSIDQFASSARRVLSRYPVGAQPVFVQSRLKTWERLQELAVDDGWGTAQDVREHVATVRGYFDTTEDVLPDHLPTIGRLDDALLIDLALQRLRHEIADYEEFCRFRQVAADYAGITPQQTGLTRWQWLEAVEHARRRHLGWAPDFGARRTVGTRFAPADPRVTLFHIG